MPCRCAYGRPAEQDGYGLVLAGRVNPRPRKRYASREEGGAPMPDCVLCGNTGETTPGRLRAAELGAALSLFGALLGVAWVVQSGRHEGCHPNSSQTRDRPGLPNRLPSMWLGPPTAQ